MSMNELEAKVAELRELRRMADAETSCEKRDVHKTVTVTAVKFALLRLFLHFILLCNNMEPNRPKKRNSVAIDCEQ